jgi:hypothetical protein
METKPASKVFSEIRRLLASANSRANGLYVYLSTNQERDLLRLVSDARFRGGLQTHSEYRGSSRALLIGRNQYSIVDGCLMDMLEESRRIASEAENV